MKNYIYHFNWCDIYVIQQENFRKQECIGDGFLSMELLHFNTDRQLYYYYWIMEYYLCGSKYLNISFQ